MGGKLVFAELHTAEEGETVANPGGSAGQNKSLPPDVTDTDNHNQAEEQTWVIKPRQSEKRAAAGNLFVKHSGKQ